MLLNGYYGKTNLKKKDEQNKKEKKDDTPGAVVLSRADMTLQEVRLLATIL